MVSAVGFADERRLAEVLLFELLRLLDEVEAVFFPVEAVFSDGCAEFLAEAEAVVFDDVFLGSLDAADACVANALSPPAAATPAVNKEPSKKAI